MTTFREDMQDDFGEIINDENEWGQEVTYTPKVGSAETFFALVGERIMSGDDERSLVEGEAVSMTVRSSDVVNLRYRSGVVAINNVDYEIVNDPIADSVVSELSVVPLRRLEETKI